MRITRIPDLFAILSLPLTTVLFSGQPLGTQSGIPTVSTVTMTSNLGTGESYATDDSANSTLTYSAMTSAGHKVDTEVLIPGNGAQQDHWPDSISAAQNSIANLYCMTTGNTTSPGSRSTSRHRRMPSR